MVKPFANLKTTTLENCQDEFKTYDDENTATRDSKEIKITANRQEIYLKVLKKNVATKPT